MNAVLNAGPAKAARAACVSAEELGHKGDGLHVGVPGARELGKPCAAAMTKLR